VSEKAIGDERRMPFFWITVAVTKLIRSQYVKDKGRLVPILDDDPGLSQVNSVYQALVEIANEARAREATGESSSTFVTERAKVALYAGCSVKTVDRVVIFLERIGLVSVERRRKQGGKGHLPSRYTLIEPDSGGGDSESPGSDRESRGGGDSESHNNSRSKNSQEGGKPPKTSSKKVGRHAVTDAEYELAGAVVATFNEIFDTAVSTDAHLVPVVGRIRERPELNATQHRKVMEAVAAGRQWWDTPAPRIVYGNAARFEESIEAARAVHRRRSKTARQGSDANERRRQARREQGLDD